MAENIIFYGPPGTGKTFFMQKMMSDYIDYNIDDETIRHTYMHHSEKWLLIALVLLQANHLMNSAEISERIDDLHLELNNFTPSDTLELHSVASDRLIDRQPPRIFSRNDGKWFVDKAALFSYEHDFVKKYMSESAINKRFEFVTFHQSFSYEDFVEGIRPAYDMNTRSLDYSPKDGVFKRICKKATEHPENSYAIFIDEINRGNIAEIFGELISLIEPDKRKGEVNELETTLPYSKDIFSVPNNLNIYGTMNSADKSIAAIDIALRRRFQFKAFPSNSHILADVLAQHDINANDVDGVDLVRLFDTINSRIELLLDANHMLGHAYFMKVRNSQDIADVIAYKVVPLLEEYFFDDPQKIQLIFNSLNVNGELKENAVYYHEELSPDNLFSYTGEYDIEPVKHFFVNPNLTSESLVQIYQG